MQMTDRAGTADYIIIGSGPAGCVLANRLSADPDVRVLLLEAGGSDRHPLFHMPAGFAKMTKGIASWGWSTVPQKHLAGRVLWYTQGKVIGGGSSINAQVYTRGNRRDYDGWGIPGWSYAEVLPYFKRAEDNQRFADLYHGYGGPLGVSAPVNPLPVSEAFLRAAQELGIPYNPDFNGRHQAGIGHYQVTVRDARRSSAATAYLRPIRHRPNLTVRTGAIVRRILVEGGRATGVELADSTLRAEREVLLTAGAIGSPRLLMLSGIGPADHLTSVGLPVSTISPASAPISRTISISMPSPNARATIAMTAMPGRIAPSGPGWNISCSATARSPPPCSRRAASGMATAAGSRRRDGPISSSISASAPASRRELRD